jgi:CHAT domain-containing protein
MALAISIAKKTGDTAAKDAAISFSERSKAQVLREALKNARVRHFAGIPDGLLEEEKRLKIGLTNLLKRSEWTRDHADSASSSALRIAILDKSWQIERLEDSLAILNPRFSRMFDDIHPAGAAVLQSALDSATCLIEYNVTRSSSYAFVVRKGSFDIVELGRPKDVDSLAKNLRHGLRTMNDAEYLTAARRLYALLIRPVESHIAGAGRLVIVPDGPLYYLPFEVLLSRDVSGPGDATDFRKLPYLVDRFEVSYALSGTLYSESRSGNRRNRSKGLSFAGFAPASHELDAADPRKGKNHSADVACSGRESVSLFTERLGALPYSEEEVKSIAREFTLSGRPGKYVSGPAATKQEFEADAPGNGVIHIATHGLIDEESPGSCALVFSPPPGSGSEADALLYAGEVYELRLDADLVTLSSCESGVGKLVRGEGLMAMTRGFFYAGARNVLCSLWKVYERQAGELMREFYRHVLGGEAYPTALRKAKLRMITSARSAHPFKWAGFELIGE